LAAAFSLKRRVLFSETDVAGIVHFSNYFRYFEDAEHALWREAGLSIHETASPIGWPRVSASCEYHRALTFEQDFEIRVAVAEITRRTIRYEGTITRDGERVASATWKIACVSKLPDGGMKSTEIPSAVTERLEPFTIPPSSSQPPTASSQPPASVNTTAGKPTSA
jgi:YbgC/YbaW family acyl-CoA thioester hydrolase